MKKNFLCFGIVTILLVSCQSDDPSPVPNERKDIQLTRSEVEMVALGNEFAFDFFKTIYANEKNQENIFISPLSASIALCMTANGAAGQTLEEMKTALRLKEYSLDDINTYYQKLTGGLLAADRSTTLGIANSIWIKKEFEVKQPFIDLNKRIYDAEVRTLDFNSSGAVDIINQWCSDKTNKRIPKVLQEISPYARLFLINALYFKGIWTSKFDKKNTNTENFTTASGQTNKVDMMHQQCETPYTHGEGVQIAELPYGNQAFSMIILLPEEGRSVDDVMEQLNAGNWENWMERLHTCTVDVKLPKFKLEYERKLIHDLEKMGMTVPFSPAKADFSNMSSADELFIGVVQQNTFVEVNEEGTEAAAVTVVSVDATAAPGNQTVTFHANRPFIYVIKEKSTGAILFMGMNRSVDNRV